jgi:hypothetical protein
MRIFARRSEHQLNMPIERPHHADARMHQKVAAFRGHEKRLDGCLPFFQILFGLRKLHDIIGSVLEGDDLTAISQHNRIVERSFPAAISQWRAVDRSGDISRPSNPADRARPENRPLFALARTLPTRVRNQRGPVRTLRPLRSGVRPDDCPDKIRNSIPMDRCRTDCLRAAQSSRRERRRNRCASSRGARRSGGG